MLPSATCSEDYARLRIENSPLSKLFPTLTPLKEEKIMSKLDEKNQNTVKSVLSGLIIKIYYGTGLKLSELQEILNAQIEDLCSTNIGYVTEVFTSSQQEIDEEEEDAEYNEGDDNDREEEEEVGEEETSANN